MNKIRFMIVFLIAIMVIVIIPKNEFAQDEEITTKIMYGDVNNDKKIDSIDLLCILRHIYGENNKSKENWILKDERFKSGDVTKDGKIDARDILVILRYIASKKDSQIAQKHPDWLQLDEINNQDNPNNKPEDNSDNKPEDNKDNESEENKDNKAEENNKIEVSKIELNKKELTLEVGKTETLKITITPQNATDKTISWSSSNEKVAKVDKNGKITAVSEGTATITAKSSNGISDKCEVKVKKQVIEVKGVKLNKSEISLEVGKTQKLTVTVTPKNATNKTISWSSSNEKVAKVDKNGKITAVSEGIATITAKSSNGISAKCKVKVKKQVIEVKEVKLNKSEITIEKGKTETLKVTITPKNATNKTISWSSSNKKVAKVDKNGKVTAVSKGTATITAKSSNGKTDKVTVKVTTKTSSIENEKIKVNGKTITKGQYANFRNVYAGKIGKNILYRCLDPIVNSSRKDQAKYADEMLKQNKVNFIFNMADSKSKISSKALDSQYYKKLYNKGKVYAIEIEPKYSTKKFNKDVVSGLKLIAKNEGPYAIHCKIGRDRTGFVLMLIECLMDVPYDYMYKDFKTSFENLNITEKDTKTEKELKKTYNKNFSRNLKIITGIKAKNAENPKKGDWSKANFVKSAETYLKNGGMTDKEIKNLKTNLSGKSSSTSDSKSNEKTDTKSNEKSNNGSTTNRENTKAKEKVYFLKTQYNSNNEKTNKRSDAILLESNGKYAMIDTGNKEQAKKTVEKLKKLGVKKLEFIILTHMHYDHIGGYEEIIKNISVKTVYMNKYNSKHSKNKESFSRMKKVITASQKYKVSTKYAKDIKNSTVNLEKIKLQLYNTKVKDVKDENENSIGILAKIHNKKIFFAADLCKETITSISKKIGNVDVYKASHHGIVKNNPKDALKVLKPGNAIITDYEANRSSIIGNLKKIGTKNIYCTGKGTVELGITEKGGITVQQK